MNVPSYLVRCSPIILPLVAVGAATVGLGESQPDNILFAAVATLLSGIIPACVLLGVALLVTDLVKPSSRPVLLIIEAVLTVAVIYASFHYGQGLYF